MSKIIRDSLGTKTRFQPKCIVKKSIMAAVSFWLLLFPPILSQFLYKYLNSENSFLNNFEAHKEKILEILPIILIVYCALNWIAQIYYIYRASLIKIEFYEDMILYCYGVFRRKVAVRTFCGTFKAFKIKHSLFYKILFFFRWIKSVIFNYGHVIASCPGGPNQTIKLFFIKRPDALVQYLQANIVNESVNYNYAFDAND